MAKKATLNRRRTPVASRPYMPGYGILDANKGKGLMPWKWATDRLKQARTYWLATVRPDNAPHVMPGVWFEGAFYFSTGAQSRKARNLASNSRCVVAVELSNEALADDAEIHDSVIVEGVAEKVTSAKLQRRFGVLYGKKYHWDMQDFSEPVYSVHPRVVFGLAPKFNETATRWTFGRGRA